MTRGKPPADSAPLPEPKVTAASSTAFTDVHLMTQVSAASVDAFAELYDRYCDRAYRLAFSVCRDDGRAQDAVQDAFLSVWRSRSSYRPDQGTVAAWLLTIVRHRAIDLTRRNAHHDAHGPMRISSTSFQRQTTSARTPSSEKTPTDSMLRWPCSPTPSKR
jgi:DNA-directed RNA polymerase specialized sigma24 family protein